GGSPSTSGGDMSGLAAGPNSLPAPASPLPAVAPGPLWSRGVQSAGPRNPMPPALRGLFRTRLILPYALFLALLRVAAPLSRPSPPSDAPPGVPLRRQGCRLSPAQQVAAVGAFKKMMPVFRHPRCANCHGGVNPFIEGTGADPKDNAVPASTVAHGGGRIARQDDRAPDGTLL